MFTGNRITLEEDFALFVDGLRLCAAEACPQEISRLEFTLIFVMLRTLKERVAAVFARLRAGLRPRVRAEGAARSGGASKRRELPRRFGWLFRMVPGSEAYAGQLLAILDRPEMQEMLAASPYLARLLRPLCAALGLKHLPAVLTAIPARKPRQKPEQPAAPATQGNPPQGEPRQGEPRQGEPRQGEPPNGDTPTPPAAPAKKKVRPGQRWYELPPPGVPYTPPARRGPLTEWTEHGPPINLPPFPIKY